ncbi:MAG: protein-glutamate O-methyltransferase CheR [Campylobacterota bacterium]|nr:protein-glutamate O-methyltransferase CheR [Campylobacterota bacterium]
MNIKDDYLTKFLNDVYNKYGDDFVNYNYSTIKRRIETHCIKLFIDDFDEYTQLILSNDDKFNEMFLHLSINVTEFFREPEQLKLFRDKVVPYLNSYTHLKIWYAGSSSGEDPYSLAIILHEAGILNKCQIYATDFNNRVLSYAKEGLYEIKDFKNSYENYEKSGGTNAFKEYFIKKGRFHKIRSFLKEKILFFNHNLATDGVVNEFQLIICKNVLIYFDDKLKQRVFKLFDDSLDCNGFLILGGSEYLLEKYNDRYKLYIPKSKVFHKKCR